MRQRKRRHYHKNMEKKNVRKFSAENFHTQNVINTHTHNITHLHTHHGPVFSLKKRKKNSTVENFIKHSSKILQKKTSKVNSRRIRKRSYSLLSKKISAES